LGNGHWAGLAGFYSRVGSDTIFGFGFGFRPKVPVYFRWHIRFRPNVIRHFRLLSVTAESGMVDL